MHDRLFLKAFRPIGLSFVLADAHILWQRDQSVRGHVVLTINYMTIVNDRRISTDFYQDSDRCFEQHTTSAQGKRTEYEEKGR